MEGSKNEENVKNEQNGQGGEENVSQASGQVSAGSEEKSKGFDVSGAAGSSDEGMEELLKQILAADKKEVKYAKAAAFFTFGLFAVMLAAVVILVPKVVETLSSINKTAISVEQTITEAANAIENAEQTIKNIDAMSGSLTTTSDTMNQMLVENSENLAEAVDKMNKVDFDSLNQAIKDLEDAVGPFARLMNRLK